MSYFIAFERLQLHYDQDYLAAKTIPRYSNSLLGSTKFKLEFDSGLRAIAV